jgi:hypothetical protein
LLLAFALIWFSNLEFRRLAHPDEGRYAEIGREIAITSDWVTPRLNGIKYFEKPALQYWITAAAFDVFGMHHWTARAWPALAGFLGVLFIGYVGCRIGGPTLGMYSAAALGGCVWWVLNAHVLTLDTGLSFWMSVGMGSLPIAQRGDEESASNATGCLRPAVWRLPCCPRVHRDRTARRRVVLSSHSRATGSCGGACTGRGALLFSRSQFWFVVVSVRTSSDFFIHEHFTCSHQRSQAHSSGGFRAHLRSASCHGLRCSRGRPSDRGPTHWRTAMACWQRCAGLGGVHIRVFQPVGPKLSSAIRRSSWRWRW